MAIANRFCRHGEIVREFKDQYGQDVGKDGARLLNKYVDDGEVLIVNMLSVVKRGDVVNQDYKLYKKISKSDKVGGMAMFGARRDSTSSDEDWWRAVNVGSALSLGLVVKNGEALDINKNMGEVLKDFHDFILRKGLVSDKRGAENGFETDATAADS